MHPVQKKIIALLTDQGSVELRYREIGRKIGEVYPQKVKHHIESLLSSGDIKESNGSLFLSDETNKGNSNFVVMPAYGMASCGPGTIFSENNIESKINISKSALPSVNLENFYLVEAYGSSMNKARIKGKNIEQGDLVLVNIADKNLVNGDYVLFVLDGCASIKKYQTDDYGGVMLISESTENYQPVILGEGDGIFLMGKVIDVIKMPKQN